MKLFLDTNIVIDFIGNREPFSSEAAALFQLASDGAVQLLVSDLSFINIVNILRRLHYPLADIFTALTGIRPLISITGIGGEVIDECLRSHWADFEDYAQYTSAKRALADRIITRNKKDYPSTSIPVLTPTEFLDEIGVTL